MTKTIGEKIMSKWQILMCFEANENENWQTMFD